jgi:hypothetical protein
MTSMTPILVYLDQNFWARFATSHQHLAKITEEFVNQGMVIVPISLVHVIETFKASPRIREVAIPLMERLSAGHFLVNPIDVFRLEFLRFRGDINLDELRHRLITRRFLGAIGSNSSILFRVLESLANLSISFASHRLGSNLSYLQVFNQVADSVRIRANVDQILARGALAANVELIDVNGQPIIDRIGLAKALSVSPAMLPTSASELLKSFPSIAQRYAIHKAILDAKATGYEGNDLTDVAALSTALPYFQIVTTDVTMHKRVRAAARSFRHEAIVVSKIDKYEEAIREEIARAG